MMKRAVLTFALISAAFLPTLAQKIETENTDRKQIIHLRTALDHLTVIELDEPVLQVASGSPSFKVEWRENKVFIQPTEADTRTNLFIWTAGQRLNYELEPAGAVTDMDFAVDQTPLHPNPTVSLSTQPQPVQPTISDLLLEAQPVRTQPKQNGSKPVEVWISDLYEKEGHLLVRYTVFNRGTETYSVNAPQVFQLDGVRAKQSLYSLTNSQLSDEQASKLKINRRVPVKVLEQDVQLEKVAPGEQTTGLVSLEMASSSEPTVLSFQFPAGDRSGGRSSRPITAYLVR
jgi:hypothetical protein